MRTKGNNVSLLIYEDIYVPLLQRGICMLYNVNKLQFLKSVSKFLFLQGHELFNIISFGIKNNRKKSDHLSFGQKLKLFSPLWERARGHPGSLGTLVPFSCISQIKLQPELCGTLDLYIQQCLHAFLIFFWYFYMNISNLTQSK